MSARLDTTVMRFALVGALNTLGGLAIIYAAKAFFGAGDVEANAIGYGGGMLLSFALNRRWTFGHRGDPTVAFFLFIAVLAVAYACNLATVVAALSMGVDGYLAQALGVFPYAAVAYLGSRYIAFAAAGLQRSRGAST